jgi:hypothetical protein
VGVGVGVADGVGVGVAVALGVGVGVAVALGVGVGVAVALGVGVGVGVTVALALALAVGVWATTVAATHSMHNRAVKAVEVCMVACSLFSEGRSGLGGWVVARRLAGLKPLCAGN